MSRKVDNSSWETPVWSLCPAIVTALVYVALKSRTFHWFLSDENIYYYLAWSLDSANLPYRDFFYANPPLLPLLLKAGGWLSGWSVAGLRGVPLAASLVSGWIVYRWIGRGAGALVTLPLCVYWFSYDALRASTHATGINVTLAFAMGAYLAGSHGRARSSALLLGLALWTKTYACVALPGILLAIWLSTGERRKRSALEFLAGVSAALLLLAAFGTLIGGRAFWEMNIFYHLDKPAGAQAVAGTLASVANKNVSSFWVLVLTCAAVFFRLRFSRPRPQTSGAIFNSKARDQALVGAVHLATVTVFLLLQSRVFDFYCLLYLPGWIALMAGILGVGDSSEERTLGVGARSVEVGSLLIALALFGQTWIPDSKRPLFNGPIHYWGHEARNIDSIESLAGELEKFHEPTLCGDSATAPLLALISGTRLALGEADTNSMRFRTGNPSPERFIERLEAEDGGVDFLLTRVTRAKRGRYSPSGMFVLPEFLEYATESFDLVGGLTLTSKESLRLWKRKPRSPTDR